MVLFECTLSPLLVLLLTVGVVPDICCTSVKMRQSNCRLFLQHKRNAPLSRDSNSSFLRLRVSAWSSCFLFRFSFSISSSPITRKNETTVRYNQGKRVRNTRSWAARADGCFCLRPRPNSSAIGPWDLEEIDRRKTGSSRMWGGAFAGASKCGAESEGNPGAQKTGVS